MFDFLDDNKIYALHYIEDDFDIYTGERSFLNGDTNIVRRYKGKFVRGRLRTETGCARLVEIKKDERIDLINESKLFNKKDFDQVKLICKELNLADIENYLELYKSIHVKSNVRNKDFSERAIKLYIKDLLSEYAEGNREIYLPNGSKFTNKMYERLSGRRFGTKEQDTIFISYLINYGVEDDIKFKLKPHEAKREILEHNKIFEKEAEQFMHHIYQKECNILFYGNYLEEKLEIVRTFADFEKLPVIELNLSSMQDSSDLIGHNPTYSNANVGRIFEEIDHVHTTKVIFILKGLDELCDNTTNAGSLKATIDNIITTRKVDDDYLRETIDISKSIIIGTCYEPKNMNNHTLSQFNIVRECDEFDRLPLLVDQEIKLRHWECEFSEEAKLAIMRYSRGDIYSRRYKDLIKSLAGYYKYYSGKLGAKEVDKVYELFYKDDKLDAEFIEYYDYYAKDVLDEIYKLKINLKNESNHDVRNHLNKELEYLYACHKKEYRGQFDPETLKAHLNETHVGMYDAKVELIATLKALCESKTCNNLLLHSLIPGMGKTSIIMEALNFIDYPYVRINCPQISSLATLYGDNNNPGILLDAILKAKTNSGIIFLEEIDKCPNEIAAALLNLCDSKNVSFYAPFVTANIEIDGNLVIASANDVSKMMDSLLNRFKAVAIPEYNINEKMEIVNNLKLTVNEDKLENYLYTHPFSSIRNLEIEFKNINTCANLLNVDINDLLNDQIKKCKGHEESTNCIGVNGSYAYITKLESIINDKADKIYGNVDKTIEEAFDIILYNLRKADLLKENEHVYINIYGNNNKKCGSSLSLALYASVLAAIKHRKINDCAFSGDVNFHGEVLEVGEIKLKLRAAKMMGINKVFIPLDNYHEIEGYLNDYKGMQIIPIASLNELIEYI